MNNLPIKYRVNEQGMVLEYVYESNPSTEEAEPPIFNETEIEPSPDIEQMYSLPIDQ